MRQGNGAFLGKYGDQFNLGGFKSIKIVGLKQPLMNNPVHFAAFRELLEIFEESLIQMDFLQVCYMNKSGHCIVIFGLNRIQFWT